MAFHILSVQPAASFHISVAWGHQMDPVFLPHATLMFRHHLFCNDANRLIDTSINLRVKKPEPSLEKYLRFPSYAIKSSSLGIRILRF